VLPLESIDGWCRRFGLLADTEAMMDVTRYEILIEGTAGSIVETALDGFEAHALAGGRSRLVGDVIDQAHLQALLQRLGNLHVSIVDVHRIE
jgi:hypothetical protein